VNVWNLGHRLTLSEQIDKELIVFPCVVDVVEVSKHDTCGLVVFDVRHKVHQLRMWLPLSLWLFIQFTVFLNALSNQHSQLFSLRFRTPLVKEKKISFSCIIHVAVYLEVSFILFEKSEIDEDLSHHVPSIKVMLLDNTICL